MLNKRRQQVICNKMQDQGQRQKNYTDPSEEYNINMPHPKNMGRQPKSTNKQVKKTKPQFLVYNRLHQKLQMIEQKIEQIKASMQNRKQERLKKNSQRKEQIKRLKMKNVAGTQVLKKDQKYNQNQNILQNNVSSEVLTQMQPQQKNEYKNSGPTSIESRKDDGSKQNNVNLSDFITQQSPMTPELFPKKEESMIADTISINSLVTFMPESNGHTFDFNPYSPRSNVYYVSEVTKGYKDKSSLVHEHLKTSIFLFEYFSQTKIPLNSEVQKRAVNLPIKPGYEDKKTIIFDLDQTLIHCTQSLNQKHEIKLPITFSNGTVITAGINVRPGAVEILQKLHENFELIVFTASHYCYANVVIDYLDPERKYIQHRLYRQHCYLTPRGEYVKDLRIINREPKNMVLIDNAAYSYVFQPENGIPIIPYYHGEKDYQLKMLVTYIEKLLLVGDVRLENRKTFRLNRYRDYKPTEIERLVQDLYINKIE